MSQKFDLSVFTRIATERGGHCLSDHYIDSTTKLRWRCAEGHEWEAAPQKVKSGQWCPKCARRGAKRVPVTVGGVTFPSIRAAAEHFRIDRGCVEHRLSAGWAIEEAFGLTPRASARTGKSYSAGGNVYSSRAAMARAYGLEPQLVLQRIRNGWTLEQSVGVAPPPGRRGVRGKPVTVGGVTFESDQAAAVHFGVQEAKALSRIRDGWTPEQAFEVAPPPRRRREYRQYEEIDGVIFPRGDAGDYKLYLVTNSVNGKEYVGITLGSLEKRWGEHLSMGKNFVDSKLKRAIRKHGADKFRTELLRNDAKSYKDLMEQEKVEIARRGTYLRGYNGTLGGELVFNARPFSAGGMTFPTLAGAAEYFGIDEALLRARLDAMGWSPEEAVGLVRRPPNKYAPKKVSIAGVTFDDHKAAARHYGIDYRKYNLRLTRYGWTPEQAVGIEPPPRGPAGISKEVVVVHRRFRSIAAAAVHFGVDGGIAAARLKRGWSVEQALGVEPPPVRKKDGERIVVRGVEYRSLADAGRAYGLEHQIIWSRLKNGWSIDEAFGLTARARKPTRTRKLKVAGMEFSSVSDACRHFGVPYVSYKQRRRRGLSEEESLGLTLHAVRPKPSG